VQALCSSGHGARLGLFYFVQIVPLTVLRYFKIPPDRFIACIAASLAFLRVFLFQDWTGAIVRAIWYSSLTELRPAARKPTSGIGYTTSSSLTPRFLSAECSKRVSCQYVDCDEAEARKEDEASAVSLLVWRKRKLFCCIRNPPFRSRSVPFSFFEASLLIRL
jgi:hypothetical protein